VQYNRHRSWGGNPSRGLLSRLAPAITQGDGTIEYRFAGLCVDAIRHKVTMAFKLENGFGCRCGEPTFYLRLDGGNAVRVQVFQEVARFTVRRIGQLATRVGAFEEAIVQAHFCSAGMRDRHPVAIAFDFVVVGAWRATLGVFEVGGVDGGDVAVSVFIATGTFNDETVTQSYFVARVESVEAFGWFFGKVFTLNPQFA
jgi:hypothetical protein